MQIPVGYKYTVEIFEKNFQSRDSSLAGRLVAQKNPTTVMNRKYEIRHFLQEKIVNFCEMNPLKSTRIKLKLL